MTAPLPSESDQAAARPALLPQSSIDQDLPCTRCGYNLRGLLAEHCCPECGTPVARSAGGDRLAAADPDWLRRVCRGQTCICAACLAALCAAISLTLLSAQVSGLRVPGGFDLWTVLFGGSVLVSLLLLLVGIFVITAFEPRKTLSEQPVSLRRFVRGAATVAVATVPLRWLTVTGLASLGSGSGAVVAVGYVLAGASLVGFVSAVVGGCYYLAELARRIPDSKLASQTRRRALGFAVCLVLTMASRSLSWAPVGLLAAPALSVFLLTVGGLSALALIGYSLLLIGTVSTCRDAFGRCLAEARAAAQGEHLNELAGHRSKQNEPDDCARRPSG